MAFGITSCDGTRYIEFLHGNVVSTSIFIPPTETSNSALEKSTKKGLFFFFIPFSVNVQIHNNILYYFYLFRDSVCVNFNCRRIFSHVSVLCSFNYYYIVCAFVNFITKFTAFANTINKNILNFCNIFQINRKGLFQKLFFFEFQAVLKWAFVTTSKFLSTYKECRPIIHHFFILVIAIHFTFKEIML